MSDLRLEQIFVAVSNDTHWLYGLDENGTVWNRNARDLWAKLPMTKAEGEE